MSRNERTGWRDESLSQLHRYLPDYCSMNDIDWLAGEFNFNVPTALIEHKNERSGDWTSDRIKNNVGVKRIQILANNSNIPAYLCVYKTDLSEFEFIALNKQAVDAFPNNTKPDYRRTYNLQDWAKFMCHLHHQICPQSVLDGIETRRIELIANGDPDGK